MEGLPRGVSSGVVPRAGPLLYLKQPMSRGARYAGLAAAAGLLGILLGWSPAGEQADHWFYDFLLRRRPAPHEPPSAVLVAIDEASLEAYGGLLRLRAPLARALKILSRHEPAAVAVDVVLSEPGTEGGNRALEQAIAATPRLVLAANLRSTSGPRGGEWEEALPRFARHAWLGHVHAEPDSDGVCRRVLLAKAAGRTRRWALALEAFRLARGGGPVVETNEGLEAGGRFIPARRRESRALRIAYAPASRAYRRLALKDLLENPASGAAARNKAVFIGVQVVGGLDRYLMTPVSDGRAMSGVEINAQLYGTLARGDFLTAVREPAALSLALLYCAALGGVFAALTGRRTLAAALAVLAAAHAVPWLFFRAGQVLAFTAPAASAWFAFLLCGAYHYLETRGLLGRAEAQRDRYRRAVHYVSHEMRTPLTTIQGSSEIISRYNLAEEKQKEIARLIHQESQRLGRMVETFLNVERISSGQMQLELQPVPAERLLRRCCERAQPLAQRKQIVIERADSTEASIWGDPEFLEHACYNLLTNAVKYSPARTSITVRAWHENDSVLISVEDRGYGMDESELKNVFRKFYRTSSAQQSGEGGTGLGLAIVEEIVAQHRGSIEVESRVNEGSRFTLRLPRAAQRAAETTEPRLQSRSGTP